jgi:hypothetical protein
MGKAKYKFFAPEEYTEALIPARMGLRWTVDTVFLTVNDREVVKVLDTGDVWSRTQTGEWRYIGHLAQMGVR